MQHFSLIVCYNHNNKIEEIKFEKNIKLKNKNYSRKRKLSINNNKLTDILEIIGGLRTLIELDIRNNQLAELPKIILD